MEAVLSPKEIAQYNLLAARIRRSALEMVYRATSGHIGGSFSLCEILAVLYFHEMRIDPAQPSRSFSLYFFPRLFGSISPAKNTTTVVMIVLSETAFNPQRRVTATVTIAATEICTMFVPIRIVVIARSKLSSRYSAFFARVSPRSAAVLILTRETDAMAVSVTAKYMAQNNKTIAMIHGNRLPSSIMWISISLLNKLT